MCWVYGLGLRGSCSHALLSLCRTCEDGENRDQHNTDPCVKRLFKKIVQSPKQEPNPETSIYPKPEVPRPGGSSWASECFGFEGVGALLLGGPSNQAPLNSNTKHEHKLPGLPPPQKQALFVFRNSRFGGHATDRGMKGAEPFPFHLEALPWRLRGDLAPNRQGTVPFMM